MGTFSPSLRSRFLPIAGILVTAGLLGAASLAQERDKSAALASKLREESPLSRGEYEAAEARRESALEKRLDGLEKLLGKLDDRFAKIDSRLDKLDDRLAKIEKALKP